jgi:hypothetical protein
MSRLSLVILVTSMLAVPLACAQGNPNADPAPATPSDTSSAEPAPPPPAPTTDRPKPGNPDEALAPEVTGVAPNKATVGSVGPSVIVSGNNFVARSIVQLDGAPLATTFVSSTELRATIPTPKLATVGTLRVSVGTSPPGGGASKEVTFDVVNAPATLTALNPMSAIMGSGDTTLHVTGANFVLGASVVFGTSTLATSWKSDTQLDATIPQALLVASGSAAVKVVNPAPGGGDSTTIAFTIANPNAAVQSVSPQNAYVGSGALTLAVNGSGFIGASSVLFNGTTLATTYVSATQLTAALPAAQLVNAGDFPVAVSNPPPGGGVTTPVTFRVQYPAPQITSLTPSSAGVGTGPTDITITGSAFYPMSQVTFDGATTATTYVDASHLKATLSAAQVASAGVVNVRVLNPSPGGGSSSAVSFTINNPAPTLAAVSPSPIPAGSSDKTITLTGSSFLASSTARANGAALTTTYVSATQLTALLPSSYLLNPGTIAITVVNPAPGGGTSATQNISVGCDTSGVDVSLTSLGQTTVVASNWASATSMYVFANSGSCATTALDTTVSEPGRYWVVQNRTGAPITLSAWADCTATGTNDAFLTFYKRPTPPANNTERLACYSVISEGINGSGGYSSPDSGGSMWCPGLTKANGGGVTLAVCEKAVVHAQPYDVASTTYPPPPSFKIKAE